MTEACLTLGCPEVVRLAKQDSCSGAVIPGLMNGYALSCIRNWSIEPITREGEAAEFVADCGNMVIRDKQDDQLLGYTVSFETSQRSNELEALVTGKVLIADGGTNIGTYGTASNLGCTEPSEDPRFVLEVFYKLSKCVTGANHVRLVLPMAQFKVTEMDKEGSISFMRYTAETGIALASALAIANGPFGDFPADVVTFLGEQDEDAYTTGFDFEENIEISGACGAIEVEEDFEALFAYDPETDILVVTAPSGVDFTGTDTIVMDTDDGWGSSPLATTAANGITVTANTITILGASLKVTMLGSDDFVMNLFEAYDGVTLVEDFGGVDSIAIDLTPDVGARIVAGVCGGTDVVDLEIISAAVDYDDAFSVEIRRKTTQSGGAPVGQLDVGESPTWNDYDADDVVVQAAGSLEIRRTAGAAVTGWITGVRIFDTGGALIDAFGIAPADRFEFCP